MEEAAKHYRIGNWSLGSATGSVLLRRREGARRLFWRIWRWFPGGFGTA